jgi:hypothetical protein
MTDPRFPRGLRGGRRLGDPLVAKCRGLEVFSHYDRYRATHHLFSSEVANREQIQRLERVV